MANDDPRGGFFFPTLTLIPIQKIKSKPYEATVRQHFINESFSSVIKSEFCHTRDVFYVRREVDLKKTANINAYVMHIFGKIEPLSIHAT